MSRDEARRAEMIAEINDAWLGIDVGTDKLARPLDILHDYQDDPEEYMDTLYWLMTQPDYIPFFVKEVLGIELLPFQALIIQELWKHKFPMLIASRGAGKTWLLALYGLLRGLLIPERKIVVVGAAFRQSKYIHEYMEKMWNGSSVLNHMYPSSKYGSRRDIDVCRMVIGSSLVSALPIGCLSTDTMTTSKIGFRSIDQLRHQEYIGSIWDGSGYQDLAFFYENGLSDAIAVTTKKGYSYTGTPNHKMKILRNNDIAWCRTDELKIGDHILIDRSERWHSGDFKCTEDQAHALGLMIGDGSYVNKSGLRFATKDEELAKVLHRGIGNFKAQKDGVHHQLFGVQARLDWLNFWGLTPEYTQNKSLPDNILSSSKGNMAACLSGLFDSDGHVFVDDSRGITVSVGFTNTSKKLVDQMRYILLHYGIVSYVYERNRISRVTGEPELPSYNILITGYNVVKFAERVGFRLKRKQDKLLEGLSRKNRFREHDHIPIKDLLLRISGKYVTSDKFSKSKIEQKKTITGDYVKRFLEDCDNRGVKDPDLETVRTIYNNGDTFYDPVAEIKNAGKVYTVDINVPSNNTYIANGFISHNTGEKIRGQRANDILSDEFASMSREIFETVIAGFASVTDAPADNVRRVAAQKRANELGIELTESEVHASNSVANQVVISGTCDYDFGHFAEYWKRWCSIIRTGGDTEKLRRIFNGDVPKGFSWRDYCVFRIPYDMIPDGFMDPSQIARAKATVNSGTFQREYSAIYPTDSQGFFKRSVIEKCVAKEENNIELPSGGPIIYDPLLRGNPVREYVMGVDTASEVDNFAIVIQEIHADHNRIVHCWTTRRDRHKERVKRGLTDEKDFYSYCCRKIRDLMALFNIVHISIDSQGGGIAILEGLHDDDKMRDGEVPIWPIIEEGRDKDTDGMAGKHIIEMINFASADWTGEANHGLAKDFEDKMCLFPRFDPITLGLAAEQDKLLGRGDPNADIEGLYDTLEDCVMEIEELKNELSIIEITRTATGRDRWDTPEVQTGNKKKERLRKDRYSALLMCNMAARQRSRVIKWEFKSEQLGGFAMRSESKNNIPRVSYSGPDWFTSKVNGAL